jgi:hypothetical protein
MRVPSPSEPPSYLALTHFRHPISGEEEVFVSVGLKSNLKDKDFTRGDMDFVIVLE